MANSSPAATPTQPLKQITFAFPFRKKGQGDGGAAADFTDEHEIYRLLKRESSGSFPVSSGGMWHGGIHVTEAGAGQSMDLKAGVRCIADGEVVAWRLNRAYPVNRIPATDGQPAINASYSTGFALVKHTMEFPRGTTLTFFSLYMHLQDFAGYESDPALPWPAYWAAKVEVTQEASDKPKPGANGQPLPDGQTGLNVRASKPYGAVLGILPVGTQVSLSKREGSWGQVADAPGALYAPKVGEHVDPAVAIGKWIFLGKERGHDGPVVKNVVPDSSFDSVNVVPEGRRVKVKAGDVLGYLGRFDSLRNSTSTRMVHIEVFCDDTIKQFIEDGRNWVDTHIEETTGNRNQWNQLGVSPDPTILRVNSGVHLYQAPPPAQPGEEPNPTDVIQVCGFATLPHDSSHMVTETQPGNDGHKRTWWKIDSEDIQRNPVSGWVREQSFAGGMVTREHAQSWVDFECHDEDHDPAHTIFANTQDYVAYQAGQQQTPDRGSKAKLSSLMAAIYGVLFPTGDGAHAVDELSSIGQSAQGSGFPWVAFRASRLIPKHESEWANPAKWQDLIAAIEQHTGPRPEHEEEKKRVANLVWWDEVKAGVPGFPGSDVFHIHPVALVGNFQTRVDLITLEMLRAADPAGSEEYHRQILPYLNKYAKGYAVNTPKRIAHFLSQVAVESQFKNIEEKLDYSAKRMKQVYGCKAPPHGNHAAPSHIINGDVVCSFGKLRPALWTNTSHYEHNPENLANYVYADRYHNGPEESGDGYKYRGRGLIQTTFKSNYEIFNTEHNRRFPDDLKNFVENPDLLLTELEYGVESAFVYWVVTRSVNPVADAGDVAGVTQKINGGSNGLNERRAAFNRIASLLGIAQD
ncbi:glycoside hydrolase family 19 protein [Paraburkholderia guartelaensis]|uniref:Glycoside hydrolase family 19 protein n=1 Tax=Paraburkholderia guartelaensis TaxID=2546446 RepID=A0ABU9S8B7_9BURK